MAEEFSDYLDIIPLSRIVSDVRRCIAENISVAGLALALTIPDIMGEECYPSMKYEDGSRKSRSQYIRWYNAYVAKKFGKKDSWFDGEMCYALRCDLLHSGRADIEYHHYDDLPMQYEYEFRLVDDGQQFHEEVPHPDKPGVTLCRVRLNADMLAADICDAADRCMRE